MNREGAEDAPHSQASLAPREASASTSDPSRPRAGSAAAGRRAGLAPPPPCSGATWSSQGPLPCTPSGLQPLIFPIRISSRNGRNTT